MRSWGPAVLLYLVACGSSSSDAGWTIVRDELPQALMSIWGTSTTDVWAVGADAGDGDGPLILHYDGARWTRMQSGTTGDLWWVYGFPGGPVYFGGKGGRILRYAGGSFTPMTTPSTQTVFGIWGPSPDELWAVGADEGGASGGFAWRLSGDGETWSDAPGLPASASSKAVWKVHGRARDDVWLVGTAGLAIHWNGAAFEDSALGSTSLFTVHCAGVRCATVGGFASDVIFEHDGTAWREAGTPTDPAMIGVCVTADTGYASGDFGAIMQRGDGDRWGAIDGPPTGEALHSIWIDPEGGLWTVGGRVRAGPLVGGVLAYRGSHPPEGAP